MTNFTFFRYRTPEQMAELARELMESAGDTHAEVSDLLDVDRSSVSHAVSDPGTRRVRLLVQILLLYLEDASEYPRYPVARRVEDVLEELGEENPYPDEDPRSAAWAEGLHAGLLAAGAFPDHES